jgi:hypothetical protein
MTLSLEEANTIAVENFQKYLRIRTLQPTPDYEGCAAFLKEIAEDVGFQYRRVEVCFLWNGNVILSY